MSDLIFVTLAQKLLPSFFDFQPVGGAMASSGDSPSPHRIGPYHSLQEAIDRIEVHCRILTEQGVPGETTEALRRLADQFTKHFMALERLRSRTAQLIELWEQP